MHSFFCGMLRVHRMCSFLPETCSALSVCIVFFCGMLRAPIRIVFFPRYAPRFPYALFSSYYICAELGFVCAAPARRRRRVNAAAQLRCLPTGYAADKRNMSIGMPPYRINRAVCQKRTAKSTDRERYMPFPVGAFLLEYYFHCFHSGF